MQHLIYHFNKRRHAGPSPSLPNKGHTCDRAEENTRRKMQRQGAEALTLTQMEWILPLQNPPQTEAQAEIPNTGAGNLQQNGAPTSIDMTPLSTTGIGTLQRTGTQHHGTLTSILMTPLSTTRTETPLQIIATEIYDRRVLQYT